MAHVKDISGLRFGRLVALECVGRSPQGDALWRCKCDCGAEHIVRGIHLRKGAIKSCGCLLRESKKKQ